MIFHYSPSDASSQVRRHLGIDGSPTHTTYSLRRVQFLIAINMWKNVSNLSQTQPKLCNLYYQSLDVI